MNAGAHMSTAMWRSGALLTWGSPSSCTWVPVIELICYACEASTVTHRAILPAFLLHFDRIPGCWIGNGCKYGLLICHCRSLQRLPLTSSKKLGAVSTISVLRGRSRKITRSRFQDLLKWLKKKINFMYKYGHLERGDLGWVGGGARL